MVSNDLILQRRPFGSWLLGPADQSVRRLRFRVTVLLELFILTANVIGAAVVAVLIIFVLPGEPIRPRLAVACVLGGAAYLLVSEVVGGTFGHKRARRATRWLREGRPATDKEQRAVLRLPLVCTLTELVLWGLGTVGFLALALVMQPEAALRVGLTMLFGALSTCANVYLLSEFAFRPVAARAMREDPPRRMLAAGVLTRNLVFWTLGSALPVIGLMIVAVMTLIDPDATVTRLSVTMLALGGVTIVFGGLLALLVAKATVHPVRSVRRALDQVKQGELDVSIPVYDGTELGSLQAGFNRMAAGLRERERIRELFGRYVGPEVVEDALARSVELGGEERTAAVLFVDLVGSTGLAASRPPGEVVELLNRFFRIVGEEVEAHGGFINKFEGDAALAIFGAPADLPDSAGAALASGRAISDRLAGEGIEAGIGVSAGTVVAGTIGAQRRYEYTVIGDPVNQAARLTELAKGYDGRLVASMDAVEAASAGEAEHWTAGDEVTLRGRDRTTRLAHSSGRRG